MNPCEFTAICEDLDLLKVDLQKLITQNNTNARILRETETLLKNRVAMWSIPGSINSECAKQIAEILEHIRISKEAA